MGVAMLLIEVTALRGRPARYDCGPRAGVSVMECACTTIWDAPNSRETVSGLKAVTALLIVDWCFQVDVRRDEGDRSIDFKEADRSSATWCS